MFLILRVNWYIRETKTVAACNCSTNFFVVIHILSLIARVWSAKLNVKHIQACQSTWLFNFHCTHHRYISLCNQVATDIQIQLHSTVDCYILICNLIPPSNLAACDFIIMIINYDYYTPITCNTWYCSCSCYQYFGGWQKREENDGLLT
jgi:hypothetical protein